MIRLSHVKKLKFENDLLENQRPEGGFPAISDISWLCICRCILLEQLCDGKKGW
jgi:hypothetical protein